jgi:hypothetical protein
MLALRIDFVLGFCVELDRGSRSLKGGEKGSKMHGCSIQQYHRVQADEHLVLFWEEVG